jgi:phospholipid N-methyltransferase
MATSALSTSWLFFRKFLRNPREVGALLPSARSLGDQMVRDLSLKSGDVVVEYGCGTGSLTASIAPAVQRIPGVKFLGIEREAAFCEVLSRRFPQLDFAADRVENVQALLAARGLPAPRAILSGLPLILLPNMDAIVDGALDALAPGGEFRTFSYIQSWPTPAAFRLRRAFREKFASHGRSPLVWSNFPPAWVLMGKKAEGSPVKQM